MGGSHKKNILIAAGGTGGHIFPAVVFGRWLEANADVSVSYMSGSRQLEADIYGSMDISPLRLPMEGSPLGAGSIVRSLRRCAQLASSFRETSRFISDINPDAVFLFGGYISFAPLLICRMKGIKAVIHEQNAFAGRVTRIGSRLGAVVASSWKRCDGVGKFTMTGLPVREVRRMPRSEAMRRLLLSFDDRADVVGVVSGSLGSRPLIGKFLETARAMPNTEFILLGDAGEFAGELPRNARFVGRQWNMDPFYSMCDALVCRGGASTLAEALCWGIPSLVVPWSGAANGHQDMNAECFAAEGGGVICRENDGIEEITAALSGILERSRSGLRLQGRSGAESSEALAHAAGLNVCECLHQSGASLLNR